MKTTRNFENSNKIRIYRDDIERLYEIISVSRLEAEKSKIFDIFGEDTQKMYNKWLDAYRKTLSKDISYKRDICNIMYALQTGIAYVGMSLYDAISAEKNISDKYAIRNRADRWSSTLMQVTMNCLYVLELDDKKCEAIKIIDA